MIRTLALTIGLLLSSCAAQPAFAEYIDPRPSAEIRELFWRLSDWLDRRTDYGAIKKMPAIIFLRPEEINYVYYERSPFGYTGGGSQQSIIAIYHHGTMMLSESFTVGVDDDVLLHEMVHHRQAEAGMPFPCIAAQERDAYDFQSQFIKETGVGTMPDPMLVAIVSQCGDL